MANGYLTTTNTNPLVLAFQAKQLFSLIVKTSIAQVVHCGGNPVDALIVFTKSVVGKLVAKSPVLARMIMAFENKLLRMKGFFNPRGLHPPRGSSAGRGGAWQ